MADGGARGKLRMQNLECRKGPSLTRRGASGRQPETAECRGGASARGPYEVEGDRSLTVAALFGALLQADAHGVHVGHGGRGYLLLLVGHGAATLPAPARRPREGDATGVSMTARREPRPPVRRSSTSVVGHETATSRGPRWRLGRSLALPRGGRRHSSSAAGGRGYGGS
jgi:hypothetical protein